MGVLRANQLYAKRSKCTFVAMKINYFSYIISKGGVEMDESKVEAIISWLIHTTIKELRGFLGLTSYYRRFIKGYGILSKPLTKLLKKKKFRWSANSTTTFNMLRKIMSTRPVLALPNFEATFVVETDACKEGVEAVLMQVENKWPI